MPVTNQILTGYRNIVQLHSKALLQVTQTVATSVPNNASTLITFTSVVTDTHSGYNTGSSAYTVKVAGWYWYSACVHWSTNTTGERYTQLNVNGTGSTILICTESPGGTTPSTLVSGPVFLNVGDVVTTNGLQNSGGTLSTFINASFRSSWSLEWTRL